MNSKEFLKETERVFKELARYLDFRVVDFIQELELSKDDYLEFRKKIIETIILSLQEEKDDEVIGYEKITSKIENLVETLK